MSSAARLKDTVFRINGLPCLIARVTEHTTETRQHTATNAVLHLIRQKTALTSDIGGRTADTAIADFETDFSLTKNPIITVQTDRNAVTKAYTAMLGTVRIQPKQATAAHPTG